MQRKRDGGIVASFDHVFEAEEASLTSALMCLYWLCKEALTSALMCLYWLCKEALTSALMCLYWLCKEALTSALMCFILAV